MANPSETPEVGVLVREVLRQHGSTVMGVRTAEVRAKSGRLLTVEPGQQEGELKVTSANQEYPGDFVEVTVGKGGEVKGDDPKRVITDLKSLAA